MKKFKVFVDIDKEEQYLNEMSQKGYALVKYSSFGVYTFKKINPTPANYRVDIRTFSKKRNFNEYVALFEDAGWQHVYGNMYLGSQYFLPKTSEMQNEDIFSDVESKLERYKRAFRLLAHSFFCYLWFQQSVY